MKTCPTKEERKIKQELFNKGLKKCCTCKSIQKLDNFPKERKSTDGLRGRCKKCTNVKNSKAKKASYIRELLFVEGFIECNVCNQLKTVESFYKNKRIKNGFDSRCIECAKKYRRCNQSKILITQREYYENNKEHLKELRKDYRSKNKKIIYKKRKNFRNSKCFNEDFVDKINKKDPKYLADFKNNKVILNCYYCKAQYYPTNMEVRHFLAAATGMKNIYCSDKCKDNCVEYGFKPSRWVDPRSLIYVEKDLKQKVRDCQTDHLKQIQIDECGYNYCEKCSVEVDTVELHHSLEVAKYGLEAISSASHILLCSGCHKELTKLCK